MTVMTIRVNGRKRKYVKIGRSQWPVRPNVTVEISAGGVVYKRTKKGLRLALILDPFGKWTFAKGHVEPGETNSEAALREAKEEMAIRGLRLDYPLGAIDFWFREKYRPGTKGSLIHKFVHYFLMEAPAGECGSPQKDEKIRKIAWVPPLQAVKMSGYKDVRPVLERALIVLGISQPPVEGSATPIWKTHGECVSCKKCDHRCKSGNGTNGNGARRPANGNGTHRLNNGNGKNHRKDNHQRTAGA